MEDGKRKLAEQASNMGCQPSTCSMCVSCGQAEGAFFISRVCNSHCEGPKCSCIGVRWCASCVLQHYWHDSKGGLKSFSRCPTCRAEFCMDDIQLAEACVDTCPSASEEVSDTESSCRSTGSAATDSSMDIDWSPWCHLDAIQHT